ncbi:MAG: helix-turn-helix transcriptional regulator, partial [Candidatus Methanoperedens sp.]
IAAWFGGMAFLYIILYSKENSSTEFINDTTADMEKKDTSKLQLAVDMLEGDKHSLFKYIVENNNILQKDLVSKTGFSEPKVSRLLDRLEKRGLIFRQRDGMGNRVLLKKG